MPVVFAHSDVVIFGTQALISYDYLLTFNREVRHIWRRGFSGAALLFYTVRYPGIAGAIIDVLDLTPFKGMSDKVRSVCDHTALSGGTHGGSTEVCMLSFRHSC